MKKADRLIIVKRHSVDQRNPPSPFLPSALGTSGADGSAAFYFALL